MYVRLSVPAWATAANIAAVARPAGDIDRLLHGAQLREVRQANADSATLSVYVGIAEHGLVNFYITRADVIRSVYNIVYIRTEVRREVADAAVALSDDAVVRCHIDTGWWLQTCRRRTVVRRLQLTAVMRRRRLMLLLLTGMVVVMLDCLPRQVSVATGPRLQRYRWRWRWRWYLEGLSQVGRPPGGGRWTVMPVMVVGGRWSVAVGQIGGVRVSTSAAVGRRVEGLVDSDAIGTRTARCRRRWRRRAATSGDVDRRQSQLTRVVVGVEAKQLVDSERRRHRSRPQLLIISHHVASQ